MEKYINEVLGLRVIIKDYKKDLPYFISNSVEIKSMIIEDESLLLIKIIDKNIIFSNYIKILNNITNITSTETVLLMDEISSYQRKSLVINNISFIVVNSQLYIPSLGILFKERILKNKHITKMSYNGQLVLLYIIYSPCDDIKQSLIAEQLNMSLMNTSRAINELEQLNLIKVNKNGRNNVISRVYTHRELFNKSMQYLKSPVTNKIYVNSNIVKGKMAGICALEKLTMLDNDFLNTVAISKSESKKININEIKCDSIDGNLLEIEIWGYDPNCLSKDDVVDPLSLYLSLKDTEDQRVKIELEKLGEDIWHMD